MKNIICADIGATNSRFALFEAGRAEGPELTAVQWLRTEEATSFPSLVENLMAGGFPVKPEDADMAVIAIAGPVENGRKSSPPFISWDIDVSDAERRAGFRKVVLINDFVAQAHACRSPVGEKASVVREGHIDRNAAAAVIGAGTALGKAVIIPHGENGHIAMPSEGGHANFPFESEREYDFQRFLLKETGDSYMTWNKVVSGQGLSLIHQFLTGEKTDPRVIIHHITPDTETLRWASRFYGRACRDYALETLATGGVYIAGGVASRTPELVMHRAFADEFVRSDTMGELLEHIPVFLMRDQNAGLWGCAVLGGMMLMEKE